MTVQAVETVLCVFDLFWQRLREDQQELNQFRLSKENEVNNEREEFEAFKRELEDAVEVLFLR